MGVYGSFDTEIEIVGVTNLPFCEGDFDQDGDVDAVDLAIFAMDFGRTNCSTGPLCEGDFDEDNDVDGPDLAVFAADFGKVTMDHSRKEKNLKEILGRNR